jgi:hypothetical protein
MMERQMKPLLMTAMVFCLFFASQKFAVPAVANQTKPRDPP